MQWPSLKGRVKVAVEPRRLQSITGAHKNTAPLASKAELSLNYRSILEAETDVHGCIKNEILRFIVNQKLDAVSPSVVWWTYAQNERRCSLLD